MESDTAMQKLFDVYSKEEHLTGRSFVKIFKDAKVLDKHLDANGLDIIFNKIKTKGTKKINYEQFLDGINEAAK